MARFTRDKASGGRWSLTTAWLEEGPALALWRPWGSLFYILTLMGLGYRLNIGRYLLLVGIYCWKIACNDNPPLHIPWEGTQKLPKCGRGRDLIGYVVKSPMNTGKQMESGAQVRGLKLKRNCYRILSVS